MRSTPRERLEGWLQSGEGHQAGMTEAFTYCGDRWCTRDMPVYTLSWALMLATMSSSPWSLCTTMWRFWTATLAMCVSLISSSTSTRCAVLHWLCGVTQKNAMQQCVDVSLYVYEGKTVPESALSGARRNVFCSGRRHTSCWMRC